MNLVLWPGLASPQEREFRSSLRGGDAGSDEWSIQCGTCTCACPEASISCVSKLPLTARLVGTITRKVSGRNTTFFASNNTRELMWSTDEEKRVSVDDFIGLLAFVGKPAPDLVSMGLRNYFRGHMMDEAAAFKPALFAQFKLAVVAPLSGSDFENWADSSPLHHHNGCSALAPLHAGFRKHGEAARDLFCGRRRQWKEATALAVARGGLSAAAAAGENWADSSPLHHNNGCSALAPLHAGCRKHGEAVRDLFCGRRCQWA